MYTSMKKKVLAGIFIFSLFAVTNCGSGSGGGSGGGGGGSQPPGEQPPGGNPPPGQQGVAPVADTFNWTGNTSMTVAAANGVLANDPAGSVITTADTTTAQGGAVNVNTATGAFTYNPPLGMQNVADTFTYTVSGAAPVTVTINLAERVWFVRNNDAGANQGNDQAPFLTLEQARIASDDNDTIFVFTGDGLTTGQDIGITLKSGQKLMGEGVGLSFNSVAIIPAATAPLISNAGLPPQTANIPVVMLATGNEVAGFAMNAAFNEAILALSGTGHNLHNNTITFPDQANGREGIRLLGNVTGNVLISNNSITNAVRNGIKVANNETQAGNTVITPMVATVTINGNTISSSGDDGIRAVLDDLVAGSTNVTLKIQSNAIDVSGRLRVNEGINIDSRGFARVIAAISGNTISSSTDEAIDLSADGNSIMAAGVSANSLSGSQAGLDFVAAIVANSTATMCLELINNRNATTNSTFTVANNSALGTFSFFESGNDVFPLPAPQNRIGQIDTVPQGTCNIPAL